MRFRFPAQALTVLLFAAIALVVARGPALAALPGDDPDPTDDLPTYYGDVAPIMLENCVMCHQPQGINLGGMVAPMSFASYEETRPWAPIIAHVVEEGVMPPWHAHPVHQGTFVGEMYLSDEEKRTIVEWATNGAPAGDPADFPEAFSALGELASVERGEWWIGEPDLVLSFREPFVVEDNVLDLNVSVNLVVPEDYTEPQWIKASELRAGSEHVHHICGEPFGCIAPGWDPYVYPDGFAMLLPPVREIRLGMHYNKPVGPGTAIADNSQAAAIFYQEGEVINHIVRRSVLSVGNDFVIPAGHPAYSLTREFPFEVDTYILSLTPHMHFRGSQAKYELEYPDGTRELLLYVPNYHFEWQRMYVFKDPPVAPAGSKLLWTPTWDNSALNPYNPDPTVDVPYGEPTFLEMGNGWLDYTAVEPINLVVGRDPVPEHILEESMRMLEAYGREVRPGRAVTEEF